MLFTMFLRIMDRTAVVSFVLICLFVVFCFFFYVFLFCFFFFFFSSRRRHTRWPRDWSSDVCSSDLSFVGRLGTLLAPLFFLHCANVARATPNLQPKSVTLSSYSVQPGQSLTVYWTMANVGSATRSEERRVGKECRAWRSADH